MSKGVKSLVISRFICRIFSRIIVSFHIQTTVRQVSRTYLQHFKKVNIIVIVIIIPCKLFFFHLNSPKNDFCFCSRNLFSEFFFYFRFFMSEIFLHFFFNGNISKLMQSVNKILSRVK